MQPLKQKLKEFSLFALLTLSSVGWAAQNKTYPTAATTQIRWDTYMDDITTIAYSTWTIQPSTWEYFNLGAYWIEPSSVTFWFWDYRLSTTTINRQTIDLSDFTNRIVEESKRRVIIPTITDNMEEYMVWPDTFTVDSDWKGWCSEIINGHSVAVACPK